MLTYFEITEPGREIPFTYKSGANNGKPGKLRMQDLYLWNIGDRFPEKIEQMFAEDQAFLQPGFYVAGHGTFERNRDGGKLSIGRRVQLIPFAEAIKKMADVQPGLLGPAPASSNSAKAA